MSVQDVTATIQAYVCGCREELGAEANFDKCWKPAEYVLWGKLLPPEALGPRCYEHAAKHVSRSFLSPGANAAVIHIGDLARRIEADCR